jgi:ATP-dependent Clp protease protease subunit
MAIHDMLRFIESPVVTIGTGWVASIAVPILFGAPRERRYSLPHTRFLLHQPSGGAGGQATDIRIEAEEILKVRERLNALIASETGQSIERVAKDSDRNYWMDAEQAREYGLVGRVITHAYYRPRLSRAPVDYSEKLSPQPQVSWAFGFWILKPASLRASE